MAPDVDAQASQIWVLGTRPADVPPAEARASTKIDRKRGAAEANTLRTEEVLPAGSRFEVFLRWDDAPAGEVLELAGRLAAWRPLIGRGVSRGRGRCVAEDVRHGTLRLDQPEDLLRWLTMSGPDLARAVAAETAEAPAGAASGGPAAAGHDVDHRAVPDWQRRGTAGSAHPDLPGGGRAGPARYRAEGPVPRPGPSTSCAASGPIPAPCEHQQCGTCWTCQVFGSGGEART